MGRRKRFIPENKDGVLVEITARTTGAKALLVPTRDPRPFNETILGVMGRAMEVARGRTAGGATTSPLLELCGTIWLANHMHCLLVVHEQQTLSRFMSHLMCNVSKEVGGRLRNWGGPLWQRRYDGIVVSDEPEVQWSRLKYLLANGVKEGLVESPLDWPGVSCAKALVHGEPLEGYWFNQHRRSGRPATVARTVARYDFATRYLIHFAQLPAFRHLSEEEYRDRVAELIIEIQERRPRRSGTEILSPASTGS